jgi:hypothetical protein
MSIRMKNFFFMRMYERQVMTSTMMRDLPRLRDSDAITRDTELANAQVFAQHSRSRPLATDGPGLLLAHSKHNENPLTETCL